MSQTTLRARISDPHITWSDRVGAASGVVALGWLIVEALVKVF